MVEDKFAQELRDKMNYGVGRLSPVASELYFSLTGAFLSLGRKNKITIGLHNLAEHLKIKNKNAYDLKSIIENAFNEIHENTFVKYQFSFNCVHDSDLIELYVSTIDNKEENLTLIERASLNRGNMS